MKLSSLRVLLVMFLAGALPACTEEKPSEECGPTASCVPAEADLVITSVSVGPSSRTHPVTGRRVVDSLNVTYQVKNAGGTTSQAARSTVSAFGYQRYAGDSLPALQPGQSVTRVVRLPDLPLLDGDAYADLFTASVTIDAEDDPRNGNALNSDSVHLARAILEITVNPLPEPRFRMNDPIRLRATVVNKSTLYAARDIQLRHCLWDYDVACWAGNWTAFGNIPIADLAPGQSLTIDYTTSVSLTAAEQDVLGRYSMAVCVASRSETSPYRPYPWSGPCDSAGEFELWPDYEACAPPVLSPQPTTLPQPNCGNYPIPEAGAQGSIQWENLYRLRRFYLFALDAVAGRTYRVTGVGSAAYTSQGISARNRATAAEEFRFDVSGRYYFLVGFNTLTSGVTATAVPL